MIPPADLAALRALIERAGIVSVYCSCYGCKAITPLVPAAREALERIERQQANHMDTNDYTGVPKSPAVTIAEQAARLARLEGALRELAPAWHELAPQCTQPFRNCGTSVCREARYILSADADTAEWQRVHGPVIQGDAAVTSEVSAQAARDVAHWRKRAENAEALCASQMARVARLAETLTIVEGGMLYAPTWLCTPCVAGAHCEAIPTCRQREANHAQALALVRSAREDRDE